MTLSVDSSRSYFYKSDVSKLRAQSVGFHCGWGCLFHFRRKFSVDPRSTLLQNAVVSCLL